MSFPTAVFFCVIAVAGAIMSTGFTQQKPELRAAAVIGEADL